MEKHIYVAEHNKGFNFIVLLDNERVRVRFVDCQFTTDDDKLAAGIDALVKANPGIARRCRKTDKEAAEKMARAHRAELARTGAVKGGVTAEASRRAMDTALAERDIELRSQNADVESFADADLQMTEAVDKVEEKAAPAKTKPLVAAKPIPSFAKTLKTDTANTG